MPSIAAALFALTAVGGIAMTLMHLKGKTIATGVALVHGVFGAAGLVVLGLVVQGGANDLLLSLILFVVAALGGFVLFANQLKGKELPTPLILVHALVAVIAFGLLIKGLL